MKVRIDGNKLIVDSFRFYLNGPTLGTYNSTGRPLSYIESTVYWWKSTYDSAGNETSRVRADGFWWKRTYDSDGNELSYNNSWMG